MCRHGGFLTFPGAEVFGKESQCLPNSSSDFRQRMETVGLADLDIQSCSVSHETKEKLVQLLDRYNYVFSKHALDWGEVKAFVHRIQLMDQPPAHYQKLHQGLSQMEEQGTMDLRSGFYNIHMAEEEKKYKAFMNPVGLHEYNKMPSIL